MTREPTELRILDARVLSSPLPFERAQPMIPVIGQLLSIAAREVGPLVASGKLKLKDDLGDPRVWMAILPSLQELCVFMDTRLVDVTPKLLATTRVVIPDSSGEDAAFEMSVKKDMNYVFDQRPDLYLPTLFHAGRVTFARFFPASALAARGTTPPKT